MRDKELKIEDGETSDTRGNERLGFEGLKSDLIFIKRKQQLKAKTEGGKRLAYTGLRGYNIQRHAVVSIFFLHFFLFIIRSMRKGYCWYLSLSFLVMYLFFHVFRFLFVHLWCSAVGTFHFLDVVCVGVRETKKMCTNQTNTTLHTRMHTSLVLTFCLYC